MSTWTIRVYCPGKWLTANIERHHYGRSALVAQWRENTVAACEEAGLPKEITDHVIITPVVIYASRAPVRDSPNIEPTIKAIVDAFLDTQVEGGRHARRRQQIGALETPRKKETHA